MKRSVFLWGVLAAIYGTFFSWYTSCGGPLTKAEVEHYVALMQERGQDPERISLVRQFLEEDTGDDFVMVNLIELREPPLPAEGVGPDESANEVLGRYMAYI